MCTPPVQNYVDFQVWVYLIEYPVEEVDDYEGVLPLVEAAESLAGVYVLYHEEVEDCLDFLAVRYTIFLPSTPLHPGELFHRCLAFFVEG